MRERKRVICCGEALLDVISDKKAAKKAISFHVHPGGSSTNTSIILANLGLQVSLISRLGTDFLSNFLVEALKKQRVKTDFIQRDKKFTTPLAIARIDSKGNSTYTFYEKNEKFKKIKKASLKSIFKGVAVFHTGSFFSYSDNAFGPVQELLKLAEKEDVFVTYDPNWRKSKIPDKKKARQRIRKILTRVDLLRLSEEDALNITGAKTLRSALDKICRYLKGGLVVTQGEKGAFSWNEGVPRKPAGRARKGSWAKGEGRVFQPAYKVKVADTIGAGDAFTAGLISRYCATGKERFWKEMEKNLEFASAASALICTRKGATDGVQSLGQVKKFTRSRITKKC